MALQLSATGHRGQRRFEHRVFKWALLSTLALPFPAAAQISQWDNPGEGVWQDPANWSTGTVPIAFDFVRFDNGGSAIIDAITAAAAGLSVSSASTSMLTIRNGGILTSGDAGIGENAGAVGAVVVDGSGSQWTISGFFDLLRLGILGEGSLTISNGGSVSAGTASLASGNGSKGTLTVTGTGSQFTARDADVSRGSGNGTINVLDGGTATFTRQLAIGYDAGAVGTVRVSGTGSSLVVGQFFNLGQGLSAAGTLTVGDGGTVTVDGGSGAISLGTGGGTARGFINIGAAPGSAAVAPGTLNVTAVNASAGSEINFNHTATAYDFAPQINGAPAVRVFGGTTTLTATNTYTGGTFLNGGTLSVAADAALGDLSGALAFDGGTLRVTSTGFTSTARTITWGAAGGGFDIADPANSFTVGQTLSGGGDLVKQGSGTLVLTSDNTYGGNTTVSGGVLQLGSGGATGAITGNVTNNGALVVNRTGTLVLDGVISGTGRFTQAGPGTTTLTADSSYGGGTTISAGTLLLGNGGATGAITGSIINNGTLAINRSGLYTFDGAISGNGALRQIGTGTTVLTADNSAFAGSTAIENGTLRVDGALGGAVTVGESGTLAGGGTLAGTVIVNGTLSAGASPGTMTIGTLTLTGGSTSFFELNAPGVVGGASNDLVIVTNNLTLGGALEVQAAAGGFYRLYNYGGTLSGSFATTSVTGSGGFVVAGQQLQTSIPGQVNLAVVGTGQTLQFWDSGDSTGNGTVDGGAGTWSSGGTNWTGQPGQAGVNGTWGGSVAVFAGAAGGAVTVSGTQAFDTLQFSTNGYVLSGGSLTLAPASGTAGTITVDSSITATIGSIIADGTATGLNKIGGGTLVLTGANTYTGATVIGGGTLRIGTGGSIASSSSVTLSASGATLDIAAAGNSFVRNLAGVAGTSVVLGGNLIITSTTDTTFAGVLSGSGVLTKVGAATLTLTGVNTYTGNTNITGGTLALGPGGSIAQSTSVFVAQGATLDITAAGNQTLQSLSGNPGATVALGANTLTVGSANSLFSGAITGSGGLIKSGTGTLTLTGANTYTGGTTINAGTLQLGDGGAITGTVANSGTLAINRSDTVTLGNTITGTGGLRQIGGGTTILAGTSTYSGPTAAENGRLVVNGAIASSTVTVTGGTLAGTGTVGGVIANSSGTVAPGNSIGTLNVAGNVSFAPGSIYEVEIEPSGTSDRLHATGTATLTGGTVSVIKATGAYTAGTRYTIVTADAGVTGTFSGFTQNLPFINLALAYDPSNVFLDVTRTAVTFCSLAGSANQCAVANSAESLGAGNALYDAIASLPSAAAAQQAFNALSGEIHASTKSALIEDSHYLRDAIVTRARLSGVSTAAAAQFAALAQATDQNQRPQDGTAITAWFQGFGAIARTSGDGSAASAKRTTGGFLIGADTKLADTWTVGLATGYSRTTVDVNGRSSRATIDSYHLALYGGAQFGALGVRLGASHTWHSIDSSRSIAFPGLADAARADYKARTTQVFGDVGYALALGDFAAEPFANLAWVHLSTNRFGERGGIAALRARGGSDSNLFSTLGIRAAAQVWNDDNKTLTLRGTLGWRHAFGDVTPAARLAFAGGASFGVEGVPITRDAVVVEAGFDLKVGKAFTVGAAYSGTLAANAHDHTFKGNLTYRF